jgi:DNA-binding transcriptional LysR family regulator
MFLEELSEYSLQSLRVFAFVASTGSVVEAARELKISQPAVTLQIHNLEKHLGFPLFERRGRNNVLTSRGRAFFENLLPELERIEKVLLETKHEEVLARPKLFVGTVEGVGEFWLSERLSTFTKMHSGVRFFIEFDKTPMLEEKLLTGQLSIVITPRKIEESRVVSQLLMEETLLPVGRADLIDKLKKILGDKNREKRFWEAFDWIGYGTTNDVDPWVQRWLEHLGVFVDRRFRYAHVINSFQVVKSLLVEGAGLSVLPLHTCENEIQSEELKSLESTKYPALHKKLYISYRDQSLSQMHLDFCSFLLKGSGHS